MMVEETGQAQGAPSAPPMMAPAAPAPVKRQRKTRSGNGTGGNRGGRRKLTPEEKEQARIARETAEKERAEAQARGADARRAMLRFAAIGAVTPNLLSTDEIGQLSKFVLALVGHGQAAGA